MRRCRQSVKEVQSIIREIGAKGSVEQICGLMNEIWYKAKSYEEALAIMMEYVDPVDANYDMYEDYEMDIDI